ncbi:hypothetical protein EF148_14190 [Stenotrophomonas maltophilia]|nr:hypothetical protein [Stenotrophomonas maltophilia]
MPWPPALEHQLSKPVAGIMRGDGTTGSSSRPWRTCYRLTTLYSPACSPILDERGEERCSKLLAHKSPTSMTPIYGHSSHVSLWQNCGRRVAPVRR